MAKSQTRTRKRQPRSTTSVRVKRADEVLATIQGWLAYNLHDRYNRHYSKATQKKLVSYGPWLALVLLMIIAPQLMLLANNGVFVTPVGFLEAVLFNRDSWGILSMILLNIVCLVDGLSHLFEKQRRGWNRVYGACFLNLVYILYQLVTNLSQPAAPILATAGIAACLFTLLDIREYYSA